MIIHCWGARGSIPVAGKEYLRFGGETTCVEIRGNNGDLIVIDAGTGIRKLGNKLVNTDPCSINLLFTHAHWDHLSGFPFFKPVYRKESVISVRGPAVTQDSIRNIVSKTMSPPYFPIELEDISANISFASINNDRFSIGSFNISTIPLNHTNQGVGYKIEEDGKIFVFLTDNELTHPHPGGQTCEEYTKFSEGADVLYHDAEYTPGDYKHTKGWGHTVYLDTLDLAMKAGVKKLGLFHHNQDRTDDDIDLILDDCGRIISERSSGIDCFAVATGTEIEI